MNEMWRAVGGFDGYYVSNLGRVKRRRNGYEIVLKTSPRPDGYVIVGLARSDRRVREYRYVHRLVADAFVPNPDGLDEVNHKDENKANNRADNLEWCTHAYNMNYGTCRRRISESMAGQGVVGVTCVETGEEFPSLTGAAASCGSTPPNVCRSIKTGCRAGGFHWRYTEVGR